MLYLSVLDERRRNKFLGPVNKENGCFTFKRRSFCEFRKGSY